MARQDKPAKAAPRAARAAGVWMLTLPCTRDEAEHIDAAAEALFADMVPPPALSFDAQDEDDPAHWRMQVYFDGKPPARVVSAIHALVPSASATRPAALPLPTDDWVTLSQQGLAPIQAGRFHVRNSAEDPRAPGDAVDFLIPASRAFGTGQHATTRGCLLMLEQLRATGHRFGNVADIGTGTGLLAFAALSLWPRAFAIATDLDPAAIDVARENMALNGIDTGSGSERLAFAVAPGMDDAAIGGRAPYDLIVANILAGPLISLAPAFAAHLADGGSLVLAGLLDNQTPAVLRACRRAGLRLAHRIDEGDWPALHLRKRRRTGWRRPERWSGDGGGVPGFGSW